MLSQFAEVPKSLRSSTWPRERTDIRNYKVKPGDNRLPMTYYATDGLYLRRVKVDGKTVAVRASTDRGRPSTSSKSMCSKARAAC